MTRRTHRKRDGGRILFVDDQPELIEGFRLLLESEGFEAMVHTSLITLPLALRELDPDLILLDLSMPALSGTALFTHGAHRLLRTKAPIVLFSGRDPRELSRITEEIGADGFIFKAQDLDDSVRRIRLWVTNRRAIEDASNVEDRNAAHSASPAAQ